jgi:hypothetical protein
MTSVDTCTYLLATYADVCWRMLTYADVRWRTLTYADVYWRMLTYADVSWRMLAYADVCRQTTSAGHCVLYVPATSMLTYADVCWRMLTYRQTTSAGHCVLYVPATSGTRLKTSQCNDKPNVFFAGSRDDKPNPCLHTVYEALSY